MLNLYFLCFKVPEFVIPPFPCYSENNSGRAAEMVAPIPKKNLKIDVGVNNLCFLCFKVPEFVLPSFPCFSENYCKDCRNGCPLLKKNIEIDHGGSNLGLICAFCALKSQNLCSSPLSRPFQKTILGGEVGGRQILQISPNVMLGHHDPWCMFMIRNVCLRYMLRPYNTWTRRTDKEL